MLVVFSFHAAAAADAVIITDIHFNPLADKSLADRLAAAPAEQWAAILDRGGERLSAYGEDSDWKLLRAALAAIKTQHQPNLVLVPGDFLVHSFRAVFNAGFAEHDAASYRRFVAKTLGFLALQLKAAFDRAPILPALGNNDSDCGDYAIRPGGPFLADTEASVAAMIGPMILKGAAGDSFAKSWTALGNYVVPNPAVPGESVAAVNLNFFSPHYRNSCGSDADGNPARATLAWLKNILADAARAGRKVILVYHIPPGADAYGTARQDSCPITPVPLLAAPYADELHALMLRYRDTIAANIAGHLHTDAFRILRERGAPFGFVMIAPALSPIFGQNPAFRRVEIGADGTIADETTFYLANLPEAAGGAAPQWRAETRFDRAWGLPRFDAASLDRLYRRIGTSLEARTRWIATYGVQGPAGAAITPGNFPVYRCSVGSDRITDVARCLCGEAR
ncbi:MAG TPA: metallophosphoesterase [Stellaceae bacterium]|nr:metallophosphoesterase [Stellaceae bacterium]